MTGLIDGDAIIWVIAAVHKDTELTAAHEVKKSVATMVADICILAGVDNYIGCLSDPNGSFRIEHYKYRKYKGNRPPKPEFFTKWYPFIINKLQELGFFHVDKMEADDIVAILQVQSLLNNDIRSRTMIMSEDKDLNQISGWHFNYKKEGAIPTLITDEQANKYFWRQMLEGDTSDNIAGVPQMGEMKVKKLFDELGKDFHIKCKSAVLGAYCKYYDSYYGNIIFNESYLALKMMGEEHPLIENYRFLIADALYNVKPMPIPARESESINIAAASIFGD